MRRLRPRAASALAVLWLGAAVAGLSIADRSARASDWREDYGKQKKEEPDRDYQSRSVRRVQGFYHDALAWVRAKLAVLHLTPAKFSIAVGLLLLVLTWSRNKRLMRWALTAGLGWLLIAFGVAAVIFDWPAFN